MKGKLVDRTETISRFVGSQEIDIVGDAMFQILIANEFTTAEDEKIDLSSNQGGYDLPTSEIILETLSIIISFTSLAVQIYEVRKSRNDENSSKVEALEDSIEKLRQEVIQNKSELASLGRDRQSNICKKVLSKEE
ncbi:MAG: hypothetical protein ACRBG0_26870 [Lewinella sp.]|uniref:hypothetical protein n=1 Tax=Lewinella sp. TaxID=2004506 RepID=UPI003D6C2C55